MELYRSLFDLAKLLILEDGSERIAEVLLGRVLEATGAERGFIVVREGERYEQKFNVRYDHSDVSKDSRRFSRNLVRRVIESGALIESSNVPSDPRFAELASVQSLGPCAVLAAPLCCGDVIYGVVYLERRSRGEGFDDEAKTFLAAFTQIAGMSLRKAVEREALEERNRSLEHDLFGSRPTRLERSTSRRRFRVAPGSRRLDTL